MKNINKIKRIQVDLLKLKPIDEQKSVYNSYKNYLKLFLNNEDISKKYFEDSNCPMCKKNKNNSNLMKIDSFIYIRCDNCDTIFNSPRLKIEYLEKMYREGEYNNYVKKLVLPGDHIRENVTEVRKFEQINSLFSIPGNILDIGCGTGVFLGIALKNGWDCTGVELSKEGARIADDLVGNIFNTSFDNFKTETQFDCISFWGVLEHVLNPIEQLSKAVKMLKENGVIVFEVPSADSLLMQYVSKFKLNPYRFIESARHLSFFSRKSINTICDNLDLEIEYIESNGLDIQTVLLHQFDDDIVQKLMNLQQLVDENLLSDHYRVFLRKKS